jgi:hypothetical protein
MLFHQESGQAHVKTFGILQVRLSQSRQVLFLGLETAFKTGADEKRGSLPAKVQLGSLSITGHTSG